MNIERILVLAPAPIIASVSGHVLVGRVNPNHLDQAPPHLWHHALLIGLVMTMVFVVLVFLDSLIFKNRQVKTSLALDLIVCAVATVLAFYLGKEWMAI